MFYFSFVVCSYNYIFIFYEQQLQGGDKFGNVCWTIDRRLICVCWTCATACLAVKKLSGNFVALSGLYV